MSRAEGTVILRCAQDDGKNKQPQWQKQATAKTDNGDGEANLRG
jgi:hypothetical protein